MYLFHETPYAGHIGVNRTTKALQQHYRWPKMDADIKAYVRACAKCQVSKPEGRKLLQPLPIPGKFWHSVSMDLITHLPVTARGNTAIVVFIDRLSKMTHLAATRDTVNSQGLARLMIDNVVRLHGVPAEVISDRDVRVTSAFSQEFYSILKVRQRMSTAFHPQTDGQTERMNGVLEEMLRAFVAPSLDDWDQHLSLCEFAINSHENESVRKSPFELLYGSNPRVPATVDFDTAQSQAAGEAQPAEAGLSAAARTVAQVADSIQHARQCMAQAQHRQKAYADKHRRDLELQVGDRVLLSTKNMRRPGPGRCLLPCFIGPHKVVKRVSAVAYELEISKSMRLHDVFHVSLLRPYRDDGRVQPPPVTIMLDGSEEFEVEKVVSHRVVPHGKGRKQTEYLVRWDGYDAIHDMWLQDADLSNSRQKVQEYWSQLMSESSGQ